MLLWLWLSLLPAAPAGAPIQYPVSGRTVAELSRSMRAQGLRDEATGHLVYAVTRWRYDWRWRTDGNGGCDLQEAEVTLTYEMHLPRHTDEASLPSGLRSRWQAFVAALQAHEAGHLDLAREGRQQIETGIRAASSCTAADEAARAAIEDVTLANIEYDRSTHHGATQGAVLSDD